MLVETWRPVPGFDLYEVSSFGNVRNKKRGLLKPCPRADGYPVVVLYIGRKGHTKMLHRLVCEVFHGPPPFKGAIALHGPDYTPANCRADNLRWGTHQENVQDMVEAGTIWYKSGEENGTSKLTWEKVKDIRSRPNPNKSALAREFGVSATVIYKILRNELWKGQCDEDHRVYRTKR